MAAVGMLIQALTVLILVDAILSWVVPIDRFPRTLTTRVTDPLYAPIRKVLSPMRTGLDLAPLVLLLLLQLLRRMLFA